MNTTQPQLIMQRWHLVQHELLPELKAQVGPRTPVPEGSARSGSGRHGTLARPVPTAESVAETSVPETPTPQSFSGQPWDADFQA
jgi:hypothetical protein